MPHGPSTPANQRGFLATCINDGDTHDSPVEACEAKAPLLIRQRALRQDSGGAGTWCGGLGVVQEVEVLTPAVFDSRVERTLCPPWGLQGGKAALPNGVYVVRKDSVIERFPTGKINPLRLDEGDGQLGRKKAALPATRSAAGWRITGRHPGVHGEAPGVTTASWSTRWGVSRAPDMGGNEVGRREMVGKQSEAEAERKLICQGFERNLSRSLFNPFAPQCQVVCGWIASSVREPQPSGCVPALRSPSPCLASPHTLCTFACPATPA
jgi:hypothetical protein